jgi:hypothetical protein
MHVEPLDKLIGCNLGYVCDIGWKLTVEDGKDEVGKRDWFNDLST